VKLYKVKFWVRYKGKNSLREETVKAKKIEDVFIVLREVYRSFLSEVVAVQRIDI
jgi:hypothetical protein